MATQAALIAETIVGLKKALRRENEYIAPDEPIAGPTNRGNKLKENARHVHEGALGYTNPHELYKEKIEHAGYTRYILRRNPPRYDSEGEELDEDETDSEADAAAAEENPFSEIVLEELLCPLKQASELPDHPTMSQPYKSKALSTMIEAIKEKLRKERALLANSHNLHRQLLGDAVWMPCGYVETEEDRSIFQPRPVQAGWDASADKQQGEWTQSLRPAEGDSPAGKAHTSSSTGDGAAQNVGSDVEMAEAPNPENPQISEIKRLKTEDGEQSVRAISEHSENTDARSWANDSQSYGEHPNLSRAGQNGSRGGNGNYNNGTAKLARTGGSEGDDDVDMANADGAEDSKGSEGQTSSPEPPRRMTTRAQANSSSTNDNGTASGSRFSSPGTSSTQIPSTHALFMIPDHIRPDKDFGLPPNEAEDTRRLLWSYIQKQEETVRGFTYMLNSLLRAQQLKDDVFEWCKAEGHVGEMSDGEDWYDREKLGLAEGEDLKKGADEEDADNVVDEGRTTGKRGRGRR